MLHLCSSLSLPSAVFLRGLVRRFEPTMQHHCLSAPAHSPRASVEESDRWLECRVAMVIRRPIKNTCLPGRSRRPPAVKNMSELRYSSPPTQYRIDVMMVCFEKDNLQHHGWSREIRRAFGLMQKDTAVVANTLLQGTTVDKACSRAPLSRRFTRYKYVHDIHHGNVSDREESEPGVLERHRGHWDRLDRGKKSWATGGRQRTATIKISRNNNPCFGHQLVYTDKLHSSHPGNMLTTTVSLVGLEFMHACVVGRRTINCDTCQH